MKRYLVEFSMVKINRTFSKNGNKYKKTSSRTAHLIEYNRRFYFGQTEKVEITNLNSIKVKA